MLKLHIQCHATNTSYYFNNQLSFDDHHATISYTKNWFRMGMWPAEVSQFKHNTYV